MAVYKARENSASAQIYCLFRIVFRSLGIAAYPCDLSVLYGKALSVEIFFAPKGTAVLFYETSLHYAPCHADDGDVFRVCVVLPKNTNTQRPVLPKECAESRMLTHNNKWLMAHSASPEAKLGITTGVVVGTNLKLD